MDPEQALAALNAEKIISNFSERELSRSQLVFSVAWDR
jgi:hypothetical protein